MVTLVELVRLPRLGDSRRRSCGRHMDVDLVLDQTTETSRRLHADAFAFFGGVPRVVVSGDRPELRSVC